MNNTNDIKKIFEWAQANGDSNIIDRILLGVLPQLLKNNMKLTREDIENSTSINVSSELYESVKSKTQELVGSSFTQ